MANATLGVPLSVDSFDTTSTIKTKIHTKLGILPAHQVLLFAGSTLQDGDFMGLKAYDRRNRLDF